MPEVNGEGITIVGRSVVAELAERNEVEWRLSAAPDQEWAEIFQLAELSDRTGSIQWVKGSGPDVIGDAIRWFVPDGGIEEADAEVRHRLSVANDRLTPGREA